MARRKRTKIVPTRQARGCPHSESVHTRDGKECRQCGLTWRLALKEKRERIKTNQLLEFLRGRKPKRFQQHVWIRPDVGLAEIYLEDISYHAEWIKGEGAEIAILRANDKTNRVVGAILPLRNYEGVFRLMGTNQVHTLEEEEIKRAADEARKRVSGYSPEKRADLLQRARKLIKKGGPPSGPKKR